MMPAGGLHSRCQRAQAQQRVPSQTHALRSPPRPQWRAAAPSSIASPPIHFSRATPQQASTSVSSVTGQAGQQRARMPEDLNDPCPIGATGNAEAGVTDYGNSVSLSSYMMLPVEQYFVLDPKQIRWIEGNRFNLTVPRVEIMNVWLEPVVEISVTTTPDRVVLKAENCRIRGSDIIENMKLDQRFCLRFVTEMTWKTEPFDAWGSASSDGSDLDDSPLAPVGRGRIMAKAQLDVWSEVIPPFNLMPREMLQASCNVVMNGLVSSLLPLFIRKLGDDYQRWATDAKYRADRATRSKPLS